CVAHADDSNVKEREGSGVRQVTVRSGETLTQIAKRYGLELHTLAAANHLTETSKLRTGALLTIPGSSTAPAARAGTAGPENAALREQRTPARQQAPSRVSANFSEVSVRQALATVGEYAHVEVLITPGAMGSVTVSIRNRTPEDAIRLVAASA